MPQNQTPAWLKRLTEPSSYSGLAALLLLAGINIDSGLMQNIIQTATGAAAIAAFVLAERGKPD